MYIQHATRGSLLIEPYDFQYELLDTYHKHRYSVNLLGRQLGKSTIAAGYLLWFAMFKPDSSIFIASMQYDSAKDIMDRIRYAYEGCPDHIRAGVTVYNQRSMVFDNKSSIVASTTTANTGRGKSISLLYLDEFAFVEQTIAFNFWASISPVLATGGKCIITSTPSSDTDQFSQIWFGALKVTDEYGNERKHGIGVNGFKHFFADWSVHPDRDEAWATAERAKLGEERFAIEHECQFLSHEETLISNFTLQHLSGIDPIRKDGQVRWYSHIRKEFTYVVALDPSMGTGGDDAAIQVLELPSMTQVAEWQHNKTRIEQQIEVLASITKAISKVSSEVYWSVENNSLGEAALVVIRNIGEEKIAGTFLSDPENKTKGKRRGFNTTVTSKRNACARLKTLLETNRMTVKSKNLVLQLKTFIHKGVGYEAKVGMKDDLVMAIVLAIRMSEYVAMWDDATATRMNAGDLDDDDNDDDGAPMPFMFI